MAQEAAEDYKLSKDCHKEKLAFSKLSFFKGMDDTKKRVTKHYLDLDLNFMDEEYQVKDAPALEVEGTIGPLATT